MGNSIITGASAIATRSKRRAHHQLGRRQEASMSTMKSPLQTNTDIVSHLAEFVADGQFLFFASVCKGWRSCWGDRSKATKAITADSSTAQLHFCFDCGLTRSQLVSTAAARVGRMDLLLNARASGCDSDAGTCAAAAAGGHLEIIVFLRANGCPWRDMTYIWAADHGHLHVIQYAFHNGCPLRDSNRFFVAASATRGGHLAILQWLLSEGFVTWDGGMSVYAAEGGHIPVLEWAKDQSFLFHEETSFAAARFGRKNTLIWLRANGFPFDENVCVGAISGNHLIASVVERRRLPVGRGHLFPGRV